MQAREFRIHVDTDSELEVHVGVDVNAYRTDWHFHDEWQVVEILSGERTFEFRSGSTVVTAGHTLVIPPRCVHRGYGGMATFRMSYVAASVLEDACPIRPLTPSAAWPRRFRRLTGVSPRAYRIQVRLLDARRRLRRGQTPSDIAAELGFADQSHFGRQFKRAFGLTPGDFLLRHVEFQR